MNKNNNKRGFITIASGNEYYYELAKNLLMSYRLHSIEGIPFGIICDRKHPDIDDFDDVVISNKLKGAFIDKLYLCELSPYDETIFIEADCLFINNPDILWQDFQMADDFSCYGKTLPLESEKSWFSYEKMGELKPLLSYGINLHGGLYYLRKTDKCMEMLKRAFQFSNDYANYDFRVLSNRISDEPIIALSMAISGFKPCEKKDRILVCPDNEKKVSVSKQGSLVFKQGCESAIFMHFGTVNTKRYLYNYLVLANNGFLNKEICRKLRKKTMLYDLKISFSTKFRKLVKAHVSLKTAKKVVTFMERMK